MLEVRDYKCGDIFQDTSDATRVGGLWYILAQIDARTFSFISLSDGNRYQDPVEDEMSTLTCVHYSTILRIVGKDTGDFRYVPPEEYLNSNS